MPLHREHLPEPLPPEPLSVVAAWLAQATRAQSQPNPNSMVLASVNAQGAATVVWSDTLNGTARSAGQAVNIPAALAVPNTYLVLAEVQYNYNPTYGYVVTGTLTLSDQIYMRPRQSSSVSRKAS